MKIYVKTFLNFRNPDQFLYSTTEHSILDQKKAKLSNFPEVAQNVSGIHDDITHFLQLKTVYFKNQRKLSIKIVKHFRMAFSSGSLEVCESSYFPSLFLRCFLYGVRLFSSRLLWFNLFALKITGCNPYHHRILYLWTLRVTLKTM